MTEEGALSPNKSKGEQLPDQQQLSITLSEDTTGSAGLLPAEKVSLLIGALKSVGVNLHDYFKRLPGK